MSDTNNCGEMSQAWQATRMLTLDEAWGVEMNSSGLQAGDVIHNLTAIDDYNEVEALAAEHFQVDVRYTNFYSNPLAAAVRLPKFTGELRDGMVLAVPTDLTKINDARRREGHAPLNEARVLSFLIHAVVHSSVGGRYDDLTRLATYFERPSGKSNRRLYGQIGRKLWPAQKNLISERLTQDSRERAERVAAYALKHMYGGGLPS